MSRQTLIYAAWLTLATPLLLTSAPAHAVTQLNSDGYEWSWSSADIGAETGTLTLHAAYNPTPSNAGFEPSDLERRLAAFQLKSNNNFTIDTSSPPTAVGTLFTDWTWLNGAEMSAGGCKVTGQSGKQQFCFNAKDINGSNEYGTDFDLILAFNLASGTLPQELDLKVRWAEQCSKKNGSCVDGWQKKGDLISAPISGVPIPAAAWLFGSGLIGLASIARKKRAA